MSQRYVEGVGLLTIDDNLSEQEIQANIDYRRSITPKNPERTFASGFGDTQSMIYRWWQKLNDEENERGRWLEDNVKEWGQHIGYYDSIALESYYGDVTQARELTKTDIERGIKLVLNKKYLPLKDKITLNLEQIFNQELQNDNNTVFTKINSILEKMKNFGENDNSMKIKVLYSLYLGKNEKNKEIKDYFQDSGVRLSLIHI